MDGLGSTKERICYRFKGTSSITDRSMAVMGIKPILLRTDGHTEEELILWVATIGLCINIEYRIRGN